jgi:hypothetical protein
MKGKVLFERTIHTIERDLCFVMMPFRPNFDVLYNAIIKPTITEMGIKCKRGDDFYGTNTHIDDIWEYIQKSRIIIADLTGQYPNVLYELGLCHAINKEVILITQSGDDIPFDLRHLKYIEYINTQRGRLKLRDDLNKTLISLNSGISMWGNEEFRVFLSHKSGVKKQTAELKEQLKLFGVTCFVAHEDIHPTKAWQDEIVNALSSTDALVALMTEDFHDSFWTDQEIGFAFGLGVPIVSVNLGRDPYGFIGKFQALSCPWEDAATEIVKLLVRHDRMLDTYIKAVKKCNSFIEANKLSEILPNINMLSDKQANDLITAFNENDHLRSSYGFLGNKSHENGNGLAYCLNRLMGQRYEITDSGKIEVKQWLNIDSQKP